MKKSIIEMPQFPYVAATVANIIWGFSNTLTGIALKVSIPQLILASRFLIAMTLMLVLVKMGKETLQFHKPKFGYLLALGVIELIYFYCESYGIVYSNVTCSGVILAASPILSMIFAAIFLKEIPSAKQVFFSFVAVGGVVMITVSEGILGEIKALGIVLLCGGCLCAAIFRVINRKIIHIYSAFERTFMILCVSFVAFLINGIIKTAQDVSVATRAFTSVRFWLVVFALGIFSSFGANVLMNLATEKLKVVELSVFGAVCTVCSMVGGILFLHEPLTIYAVLGVVMIVVGIWQVNKKESEIQ